MLLSQKRAKMMLRRQAGFSVALAAEQIGRLPKTLDGQRAKVKEADVRAIIAEAQKPTPPTTSTRKIRPFRPEIRDQIK